MFISSIAGALAFLLPVRRALEWGAIAKTRRVLGERRRAVEASRTAEAEFPRLVVMLPAYQEQLVIRQLIEHFSRMRYPAEKLTLVIVTTDKETAAGDGTPTTREMTERILAEGNYGRFVHVHYARRHRFRADQLNFAIGELLAGAAEEETYVGVYNADSTPDLDTFMALGHDACAQRRERGEFPPAYQQGAEYRVPARGVQVTAGVYTTAALQNVYTFAHYLPRLLRAERATARRRARIPVTFLGHGEFVRLDALRAVGLFPNYAYADGLLLGWEVAFAGYPIRVLPVPDECEVPGDMRTVVKQHTAWFVGLLNLSVMKGRKTAGPPRVFYWRRMLATLAWGLRTPWLLAVLAAAAPGGWGWFGFAAGCVAVYAVTPLFFFQAGRGAGALAAAVPALLIDGVGFWPALMMKLRTSADQAMPPKTDR